MQENLYQLKETFLQEWPLPRIQNMTLEEYTNLDKTSFCYWVEAVTTDVGSIWGGSAYKFGIFKRRNLESTTLKENLLTDGEYSWAKKYGTTKEIAFQNIKNILLAIIENTQNNTIENIDEIDLGDVYKWKIAFLYGDFNIINIFKRESLLEAAQSIGYTQDSNNFSVLNRFILSKKNNEQDYFDYTSELWKKTKLANSKQYWLYAPGENANKWEEFYNDGIMALGWDELGDLEQYKSRNDIKNALVAAYGGEGDKKNDVSANDDFINKLNIGDIIIVKKGRSELLGFGEVISEYYFDDNEIEYKSRRNVDWKLKGNWKVNHSLVLKTLTDITKYKSEDPNYSKYYEMLLAIMEGKNLGVSYKQGYSNYLTTIYGENSGTKTSYIKAIEILSKLLSYNIYEVNDILQLQQLYADLIKEQRNKEGKYFHPDAPSYGQNGFYSASIKTYIDFHKQLKDNSMNSSTYIAPLNQILYGPPGTGKTFNTVLEAAKIVTGNETISYDEALQVFNESLNNQIEFITFHQNYSYEDFIQGLRPDTENGKDLSFEKKDGVFKRIADRALKNLQAANNPKNAKKEFDIVFQELIQPLNDGDVDELEIKMKKSSFYITEVGEKSIEFRKNIGDSNHTLSINTLRKMYERGENDIILGGLQPYYNPILELLLVKGKSEVTNFSRKNFVIIIDEINRANISRVFGELITLIEEDKRSHGKIPMRVNLPSGDSFIVPSNLYIIGTMNTADKSISLLDIALRRRFEFVPMYPNTQIEGVNSPSVLETINAEIIKRKGYDFTIGHAYFMCDSYSLEKTINNKVIPLLLEYFMNDEKEVTTILKAAEIEVEGWPMKMKTT
ncbi:AAA family ATPase [Myroides sp. JBRI-B21084]|uniref:AAA family ATPase n=1 Tax=Myroides sp. JBRI-B21084 TaxID=3119977 RepID=UPI0026E3E96E|nr:AAA family ATPase [Paenimyroides cloacae]WKW45431.1 AAA family ATPase [Paenimyroides cloacae]